MLPLLEVATRELMLFAAAGLLVGGLDDLLVDGLFFTRRAWGHAGPRLDTGDLPIRPTKPVAIFVPTWREQRVIAPMLRTRLARLEGRADHPS